MFIPHQSRLKSLAWGKSLTAEICIPGFRLPVATLFQDDPE